MEMLTTVNQWIDVARKLLAKQTHIPLIDDSEIDMHGELRKARRTGDDALRAAIDNVLSRDPSDLAVRFVALNVYYRLMTLEPEEIEGGSHEDAMRHLGYLVRLRETTNCSDVVSIRWEIVNACAVQSYQRALALCDQLGDLVTAGERYYLLGRLHFLIAVRNTWEEEVALEYWDLPIGKRLGGDRGVWRAIHVFRLHSAGIQLYPTRALLTEEDRDHLRDAIKYLEKTIDMSEVLPSARFMLALSYACIGDGHNSARHYQWMVDNQQRFLATCAQEEEAFWVPDYADIFINGIRRCLVNAYDDAGELDNAINATNAWITVCPDHLGTYERMARLQQKGGDYVAAAEWMRKEADRNPKLEEDPNVSIILALGGVVSPSRLDDALKSIAASHPQEYALVESVVKSYWPAFTELKEDSRQQWVNGAWLLGTNALRFAGTAVHCFAWVVETRTSVHNLHTIRGACSERFGYPVAVYG